MGPVEDFLENMIPGTHQHEKQSPRLSFPRYEHVITYHQSVMVKMKVLNIRFSEFPSLSWKLPPFMFKINKYIYIQISRYTYASMYLWIFVSTPTTPNSFFLIINFSFLPIFDFPTLPSNPKTKKITEKPTENRRFFTAQPNLRTTRSFTFLGEAKGGQVGNSTTSHQLRHEKKSTPYFSEGLNIIPGIIGVV